MPVEFTKYLLGEIRRIRVEATTRKPAVALGAAGRDVLTTHPISRQGDTP